MDKLTHLDKDGNPTMVQVGHKQITKRIAKARAEIYLPDVVDRLFSDNDIQTKKGSVFQTAILAGIMGAKKTSDLIPLCHPLPITSVHISIHKQPNRLWIDTSVSVEGKTGVEMEALTAASTAALTVYDMCKGLSHNIQIENIRLLSKTGGKKDYHGT